MRDQANTFTESWYAMQIASMKLSESRLAALHQSEQGLTDGDLEAIWDGWCALTQKIEEYQAVLAAQDVPPSPVDEGEEGGVGLTHAGMTLRDYFAAQAMAGDWAADGNSSVVGDFVRASGASEKGIDLAYSRVASHYYRMADAMLEARQAGKEAA